MGDGVVGVAGRVGQENLAKGVSDHDERYGCEGPHLIPEPDFNECVVESKLFDIVANR